jgi:betaine-aldehyde dehydrogenase
VTGGGRPAGLDRGFYVEPTADRAYAVARRLRTGTVGHNGVRTDATIAFGGFKRSDIGREGGAEGLCPFLESKTVLLDELPRRLA